jgi:hypothetical protein
MLKDLRAQLELLGLPTGGNKKDLEERLAEAEEGEHEEEGHEEEDDDEDDGEEEEDGEGRQTWPQKKNRGWSIMSLVSTLFVLAFAAVAMGVIGSIFKAVLEESQIAVRDVILDQPIQATGADAAMSSYLDLDLGAKGNQGVVPVGMFDPTPRKKVNALPQMMVLNSKAKEAADVLENLSAESEKHADGLTKAQEEVADLKEATAQQLKVVDETIENQFGDLKQRMKQSQETATHKILKQVNAKDGEQDSVLQHFQEQMDDVAEHNEQLAKKLEGAKNDLKTMLSGMHEQLGTNLSELSSKLISHEEERKEEDENARKKLKEVSKHLGSKLEDLGIGLEKMEAFRVKETAEEEIQRKADEEMTKRLSEMEAHRLSDLAVEEEQTKRDEEMTERVDIMAHKNAEAVKELRGKLVVREQQHNKTRTRVKDLEKKMTAELTNAEKQSAAKLAVETIAREEVDKKCSAGLGEARQAREQADKKCEGSLAGLSGKLAAEVEARQKLENELSEERKKPIDQLAEVKKLIAELQAGLKEAKQSAAAATAELVGVKKLAEAATAGLAAARGSVAAVK